MSHSVFRDLSPPRHSSSFEDDALKIDPNLVIVVNKEGKVSVDERTLHSLLAHETTDTSVTIVRVSSPTPSMNDEMDEEDRNMTEMELLEALGEDMEEFKKEPLLPRVGVTVESFYPAAEAKTFVAEVLSLAGIDHPNAIDFEFQRYVIQNDHCYTNLTLPAKLKPAAVKKVEKTKPIPELERSARQRKPTTRILEASMLEKEVFQDDEMKEEGNGDEPAFEESGSEYASETSESSEEVDHESDLDFNINARDRTPKKGKRKKKLMKKAAQQKRLKKAEKAAAVQIVKMPRKSVSKGKQVPEGAVEEEPEVVRREPPKVVVIKRKMPQQQELLFSDMSSLFSQPDKIIREKPSTSKGFVQITSQSKLPNISIQTHPSNLAPEQDKQLDLIDSIVSKELGVDLADSALLDELGETLPDDFLAELAKDKELQEIIDKQVLSSFDAVSPTVEVRKVPSQPLPVSVQIVKEPPKVQTQVMRSDGRIVNLPPIEVPTTRAKRKKDDLDTTPPTPFTVRETPVFEVEPKKVKSRQQSTEKASSRRSSSTRSSTETRRDSTSGRKRSINPAVLAVIANDEEADEDFDESDVVSMNSEDDPNKLWCICRQPHNNRFMICCDMCSDWFHGRCVNVTKSMGKQMELNGQEWTCPNCLKEKQERGQKKITAFGTLNTSGAEEKLCIVCSRSPARPSSIYCSDECIVKHAHNAVTPGETGIPSGMTLKNSRVVVFEKQTGLVKTGENAPTVDNLKQWLRENPTFQVVTQGSAHSAAILAKQKQLKDLSRKMKEMPPSPQPQLVQTKLKFASSERRKSEGKLPSSQPSTSKSTPKPSTSKSEQKPTPPKTLPVRKSFESKQASPSGRVAATDQLRTNVRGTLKKELKERTREVLDPKAPKLTEAEIDKFSDEVEKEMFLLFGKDVGQKYKSKYRSLMFNIKDRKNLTLFQKISEKAIKPSRLVRMEPHELASQELTKWREAESKHTLEMIKKSELELLAASKNYVLKTHKGEEVFESKKIDRVEIDSSIAVEDVVSVLNSSTSPVVSSTSKERDYVKSSSSSKKDSKRRSRSRDRHGKSSKHKRKHSRERSRSRERHHKRSSRRSPERKHRDRSKEKASGDAKKDKKEESKSTLEHKSTEDYNLIDKILEASQAILNSGRIDVEKIEREAKAAERDKPDSDQEPTSTVTIPTPPHTASPQYSPSSAGQSVALWSGKIQVPDVATFKLEIHAVSGDCAGTAKYLPSTLVAVGRINPEDVWDYIGKVKKVPTREIVIVRFASTNEHAYRALYDNYEQRKKLGVVKKSTPNMKDFYVLPLAADEKLPSVLLPLSEPGFDEPRQDMLLGIIIKIKETKKEKPKTKPSKSEATLLPPIITNKSLESIDSTYSKSSSSSSALEKRKPTSKLLSLGLPKTSSHDADDEPYSPGGSDDDDEAAVISTTTAKAVQNPVSRKEELTLDDINRQIEARKLEIASILGAEPEELDEPYSPSRPVTPPAGTSEEKSSLLPNLDKLENIAIPSNLSEILASIQKGASTSAIASMDPSEEYDPTASVPSVGYTSYRPYTGEIPPEPMDETEELPKSTQPPNPVMEVDEDVNEDDFFEFPDEDVGVKVGELSNFASKADK